MNPGREAWLRGELRDERFGLRRHDRKSVRAGGDRDGLPGQLARRSEKLTIEEDLRIRGRGLDDEEGRVSGRAGIRQAHAKVTG